MKEIKSFQKFNFTLFQLVFVAMAVLLMSKVLDFWKQSLEKSLHSRGVLHILQLVLCINYVPLKQWAKLMQRHFMKIWDHCWNILQKVQKAQKCSLHHSWCSVNWSLTRMTEFLDACLQASDIIVPFLDTIIGGNIRPEETSYVASPKSNYIQSVCKLFNSKLIHNGHSQKW